MDALAKPIEEAKEVLICNLAFNNIKDPAPLNVIKNLVHLDLSKNKVGKLELFIGAAGFEEDCANLKWLDLSGNAFKEMPAIKCPKLEYLDISYNKLEKVNEGWVGHASLKVLKSVDNKFKSMAVFKNMPKLVELYV